TQHLPADLRADAPARSGDHDDPAGQQGAHSGAVQLDRLAAEQVVDVHVAQLQGALAGARDTVDEVVDVGDDLHADASAFAVVHEAAQALAGQAAGHHQDVGGATGPGGAGRLVEAAQDAGAAEPGAVQRRVVVEEAGNAAVEPGVEVDLVDQD